MQYTKTMIQTKLNENQHWLERAILALYKRQTADEQERERTRHRNRIGFNSCDAPFLTSLAKWLLSGRHLTEKQCYKARIKVAKYAGQLARIANAR